MKNNPEIQNYYENEGNNIEEIEWKTKDNLSKLFKDIEPSEKDLAKIPDFTDEKFENIIPNNKERKNYLWSLTQEYKKITAEVLAPERKELKKLQLEIQSAT